MSEINYNFVLRSVSIFVIISSLVFCADLNAAKRTFIINADDWARPRSGARIIEFEELRDLAAIWSASPAGSLIEIRYPGGDEGALWASELSDWLVSLGISSDYIRLRSGSARTDQIELIIMQAGNY